MSDCVCCDQGHPKSGATAKQGERWCQQCQKDGCPQPALLLDDRPEPACTIREHAGLEKVLQKMGMNEKLMPDPELGQDVAFLAHVITIDHEKLGQAHKLVEAVESARASWIHHYNAPDILVAIHKFKGEPEHQCDWIRRVEMLMPFCRVCGMKEA